MMKEKTMIMIIIALAVLGCVFLTSKFRAEVKLEEGQSLLHDFEIRDGKERHYLEMPSSELKALQGDELFEAVLIRTESKVDQAGYFLDGIRALSHEEQVFYIVSYYETEVNNGGLCQYFVNSSRETAPFLAACLTEIGAEDHRKLFVDFVTDNGIELNDLSSFIIDDISEFEMQEARYPFDAFDNAFFELKPIQECLTEYIRLNINAF